MNKTAKVSGLLRPTFQTFNVVIKSSLSHPEPSLLPLPQAPPRDPPYPQGLGGNLEQVFTRVVLAA